MDKNLKKIKLTFEIPEDKLDLIGSTLYRAYSMPYKRRIGPPGVDFTYEQTEEEKDYLRRLSLIIGRRILKK